MNKRNIPPILRLRKKHAPGSHVTPDAADGERLVGAQSVRQAIMAGLIVMIVFSILWMLVSDLLGRVLPWLSMLQGILIGAAVRRAGQGIDWRFPFLAAVLAVAGAVLGNVVMAAATTAREFDTDIVTILVNVTTYTWPVFFDEVMTAADFVFALFSAGLAAYYANHRLTRREYQAVRIFREQNDQR